MRVIFAALVCVLVGCGADDPSILIVSAPVDTSDTQGPYIVEVIPNAPDGVFELRLELSFLDTPELFEEPETGETWRGSIPGQPAGTRVEWFVELVESGGSIVREPQDGTLSFTILSL
ncbi:MAG: hypothetical protein AAFU77_17955 [Myxococcota bacterium]